MSKDETKYSFLAQKMYQVTVGPTGNPSEYAWQLVRFDRGGAEVSLSKLVDEGTATNRQECIEDARRAVAADADPSAWVWQVIPDQAWSKGEGR